MYMKINELSKLTGIKAETIRSYRNRNLLHPEKLPNGYYDYSAGDFISLLYIRKLRGYSMALDDIAAAYQADSNEEILNLMEYKRQILLADITRLQEEKRYLELEQQHIMQSSGSEQEAFIMQSIDDKYDLYEFRKSHTMKGLYHMMTPTLFISKEVLNGECTDQIIPIRAGLGTYRYISEENHMTIPDHLIVIPNGIHISQTITLSDLSSMNLMRLKPMMDLAKKNGTPFISDTTGYLVYIQNVNGKRVYHFRIRACIERNDIRSF